MLGTVWLFRFTKTSALFLCGAARRSGLVMSDAVFGQEWFAAAPLRIISFIANLSRGLVEIYAPSPNPTTCWRVDSDQRRSR